MKNKNCAFLLSTCDSYEDTWSPFFELIKKYWPNISYRIFLNTETKKINDANLPFDINVINSSGNCTWSQRLINVLDQIDEEYIFMVLDDFFLKSPVKESYIEELLSNMEKDSSIASYQLKAARLIQEGKAFESNKLLVSELDENGWKTHFVPTIWRKSVLKKWLRPHESIWGFELYGSQRARRWHYKEKVLVVESPVIFDYLWVDGCSVIVNGKWLDSVEIDNFFKNNNIDIDFDIRGRITLEEYRKRTLKDTLKKLSFFEIIKRIIMRLRSLW